MAPLDPPVSRSLIVFNCETGLLASRMRNSCFTVKGLLILGSRKHLSGYLLQRFLIANITVNLYFEVFKYWRFVPATEANPPLPRVRTMLLWFPHLVMKSIGDYGESFVPIFNVRVNES